MSNCDACGALSDRLSKHNLCEKCQRDPKARERKKLKYAAIRSMKKAGVA